MNKKLAVRTDRGVRLKQIAAESAVVFMAPDGIIATVNDLRTCPWIVGSLVRDIATRLHTSSTDMSNSSVNPLKPTVVI